jgi:uncharacterized cupin superfamily protein
VDIRRFRLSDFPITRSGPVKTLAGPVIKAGQFAGFHERQVGKAAGMTQFGVNHVTLEPGSISSLRHWHEAEDEFVLVLSGRLILVDDNGEHDLAEGDFAGFPAGIANGHHLCNRSDAPASFLAVGSRKPGEDTVHYPDDNLGPIRR